ncbi:glycosyltransferase family 2 protein [Dermabacteraceae bacterium P7074]
MLPKVTIVIPVYNTSDYFMEALESALNQTVPVDIIAIDDGSTDRKIPKLMKEASKRGVLTLSQKNSGVSNARNNAIKHAKTDYVLTFDSDDILLPEVAEKGAEALDLNPDASIACWGQLIRRGTDPSTDTISPCKFDGIKSMLGETVIPSNSMFRRSMFLKTKGYPEELKIGEDWAMQMRLLQVSPKVVVLDDVLAIYRLSPTQATANIDPRETAKALNLVLEENIDLYSTKDLAEPLIKARTLLAAYRVNYRKPEQVKEFLKSLKNKIF